MLGSQTQTHKKLCGCTAMLHHPVTSTSLQQITNMRPRNYLILASLAGECCSHPSPATEHLESTRELFTAVMALPYANHVVLGTYFTGLTAAKLSGNAMIMDTQGSNTVLTTKMVNFSFLWTFFRVTSDFGVLFGERFRDMGKASLSILGILKQTKENS